MNDHEIAAIALMAEKSGNDKSRFSVVHKPETQFWYDWADPATGKVGQCCMRADGTWQQDPRGEQPVVLLFRVSR